MRLENQPDRVAGNTSRLHWPEIDPGRIVEWRQDPRDVWMRVWVSTVIHEHDGQQVSRCTRSSSWRSSTSAVSAPSARGP
jgi:hypothetical protein